MESSCITLFTSQSTAMAMLGWSVHIKTLLLRKLDYGVNLYFMHMHSLVTDSKPCLISRREENGQINYFMINLHESMGPGRDRTCDPWIGSQTLYRVRYVARLYFNDNILYCGTFML